MSEMVSNQHEIPTPAEDAEALTAHLIGETPLADDFPCCNQPATAPDPTNGLTPESVFLAITHTNGIADQLPATWTVSFNQWWDYTAGNLALIRTAVDAVTYVHGTGVNIPNLTQYLDAAVIDITDWTTNHEDTPWNVHAFEARTLGALLSGLTTSDQGAYTHPLHQLVHLALSTAPEPTTIGVYGELCRTGAMGHPNAPYTLTQLQHLAEGGTI